MTGGNKHITFVTSSPLSRPLAAALAFALTLRGLGAELGERGVKVDYRAAWTFMHEEASVIKKTLFASERERPDGRPAPLRFES